MPAQHGNALVRANPGRREGGVHFALDRFAAGGVAHERPGQRPDLGRLAVVPRGLDPTVGAGLVRLGRGLALRGPGRAVIAVAGVGDFLGDLRLVGGAELAAGQHARNEQAIALERVRLRPVQIERPVGQELIRARADVEVVPVATGNRENGRKVHVLDKPADLAELAQEVGDLVDGDVAGDAAGHDADVMRHLAAEDGQHLVTDPADLQRLHVALHQRDVRGLVAAIVAFVAREEGRKFLAVDEGPHAFQLRVGAVVVGGGRDVHEVQRRQREKVQDVRLHVVGTQHEVSHDPAVVGNLIGNAKSQVQAAGRGRAVNRRADPADPLGQAHRVDGIAAGDNVLEASEHRAAAFGILDLAAVDDDLDLHVALDPRDGIDRDGSTVCLR